ncbi:hypothetical protein L861_19655 [Litchfieldella anticariensis FP35 = DSM 16096]|uniref:Poly-beta-hydroxybutyrate polymerase N-terminal domain-containing protein n=1 Tax=Litchfieldella anticariensis (strain DSM 16096 / CECT 5854 / CIP 108499 / LMG 22089 / FP35) TaxID=1121939 RepID=S2L2G7_LITA3|nr:poly-beta-hydroxybutyrate polymerase N-terminal domain-containing protein [Halomonas anticariensis]EPC01869.1 hypothetical protein L861_19655 [Halomonas anticariensis FP35 = DSM 16096]
MFQDDGQNENVDRVIRASLAQLTNDISPAALMLTYVDWLSSLAASPGKQMSLIQKALKKQFRLSAWAAQSAFDSSAEPCIEPLPQDRRFRHESWRSFPYNVIYQGFLLHQQWWFNATTGLRGLSPHHEQALEFGARQWLDMWAPSNFPLTNPQGAAQDLR